MGELQSKPAVQIGTFSIANDSVRCLTNPFSCNVEVTDTKGFVDTTVSCDGFR